MHACTTMHVCTLAVHALGTAVLREPSSEQRVLISFTRFDARDVVRHPLVQRIVEAYARHDVDEA